MIERNHPALSIGAQCRLLSISRSSFYHEPAGETDQNLGLMRLIDRQFLDTPFYGVRRLCCTNRVRDSSRESRVVAGMHEQTHTPDLQDQELASLQ